MRELGLEQVTGVEVSLVDPLFPRRDGSTRHVHVLAYFLPMDPDSAVQQAWPRCAATATSATTPS